MIPLRDVIPSRTRPWVTISLIAINVAVFLYSLTLAPDARDVFGAAYGLKWYAFSWPDVFTSMFVHAGLLHLASNMLCLWIFGDNVEDQMGHDRFLVFYLLAGLTAALAELLLGAHGARLPMIGASGAIAGVMAAYLFMFPRSEVHMLVFVNIVEIPAAVFLPLWFLLQVLGVVDQNVTADHDNAVAFWAHIGGFVMGAVGVWVFRRKERATPEWRDAIMNARTPAPR
jgi:membrane associated rhomboid family serine protease